jgi:anti-anti-sigma factor
LKLSHKLAETVILVTLHGDVDASQATRLKMYCLDLLQNHNLNNLVLDLGEVPYVDSMGLSSFLSLYKSIRQRKGEFAVCKLQEDVKSLFELCSLDKVFLIYETQEEAKTALLQLSEKIEGQD